MHGTLACWLSVLANLASCRWPSPGSVDIQFFEGVDCAVLDNFSIICRQAMMFFEVVGVQIREALCMYEAALNIVVARRGVDHLLVASSIDDIGNVYSAQGKYQEARVQHHKSLQIKILVFGHVHPDVARSYGSIGVVYRNQGKYEEALFQYQKCSEVFVAVFGEEHPYLAETYNNIGTVYQMQGKHKKALVQHLKSLEIKIKEVGP